DLGPEAEARQRVRRDVVHAEQNAQDEEARGPGRRQYGGNSAHQGPRALKAFQNFVLDGCSSSDVSMFGTYRACTAGVHSWSVPSSGSSSPASGNSRPFRNASASSPMTTTSF